MVSRGNTGFVPGPVRTWLHVRRVLACVLAVLMVLTVAVSAVGYTGTGSSGIGVALADDKDDAQKYVDEARDGKTEPEDWLTSSEYSGYENQDDLAGTANFSDLITRMLWPGYYINPGVKEDDAASWKPGTCKSLQGVATYDNGNGSTAGKRTLYNDNCAVPGIGTEAVSKLVQTILPIGMGDGSTTQAAQSSWGLGIATELLPKDCVPNIVSSSAQVPKNAGSCDYATNDGSNQYTALEQLGYNLNWSTYNGEFDYIRVNSPVRFVSGLSFGQVAMAAWAGIKNNHNVLNNAVKTHDWGKVALTILWPWGNVGAGSLNGVINAFEVNTLYKDPNSGVLYDHQTPQWTRPGFVNSTMYGAYEISESQAAALRSVIVDQKYNELMAEQAQDFDDTQLKKDITPPTFDKNVDHDWGKWKSDNKSKIDWGIANLGVNPDDYNSLSGGNTTFEDMYTAYLADWNSAAKVYENRVRADSLTENDPFSVADDSLNAGQKLIKQSVEQTIGSYFTVQPDRVFCTKADGSPAGEPDATIKQALSDPAVGRTLPKLGRKAYDWNPTTKTWDWKCGEVDGGQKYPRPTVVGGLFGTSASGADNAKYADTRRGAYDMSSNILTSRLSSMGQFFFTISQKITMVINWLIGLSFQPLMQTTGIEDLVLKLVSAFRQTIYLNLMLAAVAIGAMIILLKWLRNGAAKSFRELLMLVLSTLLGIAFLMNPKVMFLMVDEVPSAIERGVMAVIFDGTNGDTMCTSTGSPRNGKSLFGTMEKLFGTDGTKSVNPDNQVRAMQCKVWEVYVLSPWSYGQFGTGINNLYATGYSSEGGTDAGEWSNGTRVQEMAGDAAVEMGGGKTIHNWGIYQLRHMLSGTSTTPDQMSTVGVVDKNLYRLVDAQAGPECVNGSCGRNGEYFETWRGNSGGRFIIGVMSVPIALLGLLSLGKLCLYKIKWTFTCVIMLVLAPFIMLMGIVPGTGRSKMKQWFITLLSLILKRIVAVAIISIMLEVMVEVATKGTNNSMTYLIIMMVIGLAFKKFGFKLLELVTIKIDSQAGDFRENMWKPRMPRGARDFANSARAFAVGAAGAVAARAIVGGDNKYDFEEKIRNRNSSSSIMTRYFTNEHSNIEAERDRIDKWGKAQYKALEEEYESVIDLNNNDSNLSERQVAALNDYRTRQNEINEEINQRTEKLAERQHRYHALIGDRDAGEVSDAEKRKMISQILHEGTYRVKDDDDILNRTTMAGQSTTLKGLARQAYDNFDLSRTMRGHNGRIEHQLHEEQRIWDQYEHELYNDSAEYADLMIGNATDEEISQTHHERGEDEIHSGSQKDNNYVQNADPMGVGLAALTDSSIDGDELKAILSSDDEYVKRRVRRIGQYMAEANGYQSDGANGPIMGDMFTVDDEGNITANREAMDNARAELKRIVEYMNKKGTDDELGNVNKDRVIDSMQMAKQRDTAMDAAHNALYQLYGDEYLEALNKDNSIQGKRERIESVKKAQKQMSMERKQADEVFSRSKKDEEAIRKHEDQMRRSMDSYRESVESGAKSTQMWRGTMDKHGIMHGGWRDKLAEKAREAQQQAHAHQITPEQYREEVQRLNRIKQQMEMSESELQRISSAMNTHYETAEHVDAVIKKHEQVRNHDTTGPHSPHRKRR